MAPDCSTGVQNEEKKFWKWVEYGTFRVKLWVFNASCQPDYTFQHQLRISAPLKSGIAAFFSPATHLIGSDRIGSDWIGSFVLTQFPVKVVLKRPLRLREAGTRTNPGSLSGATGRSACFTACQEPDRVAQLSEVGCRLKGNRSVLV